MSKITAHKDRLAHPQTVFEAPDNVDAALLQDIKELLNERHQKNLLPQEQITVLARVGDYASWLQAQIGDKKKADVFELFVRSDYGSDLEGGLGLLVDYLDAVLTEFFDSERNAFFPLDFTSHEFENHIIFAKHEFRNFDAEAMAEALLKKS